MARSWVTGFCLTALVVASGCSGSSAPDTVPVQGTVSYQGQPVSQGTVTFHPVGSAEGGASRPSVGELNSDGTYQLSTFTAGDGAVPGKYQVVVVSITSSPSPEEPDKPEVWAIPQKYGNPVQSGLTADVPAEASQPLTIDFDLQG